MDSHGGIVKSNHLISCECEGANAFDAHGCNFAFLSLIFQQVHFRDTCYTADKERFLWLVSNMH